MAEVDEAVGIGYGQRFTAVMTDDLLTEAA
jgi:hypothetical protein